MRPLPTLTLYLTSSFLMIALVEYLQHPALQYTNMIISEPHENMPDYYQYVLYTVSDEIIHLSSEQWKDCTQSVFDHFPDYFGSLCEIWKLNTTVNHSSLCVQSKSLCQIHQDSLNIKKIVIEQESLAVSKIQDIFRTNFDSYYAHKNLIAAVTAHKHLVDANPNQNMTENEFQAKFMKQLKYGGDARLFRLTKNIYEEFMNFAFQYLNCSSEVRDFLRNQHQQCLQVKDFSYCKKLFAFPNSIDVILLYQIVTLSVNDPWMIFIHQFYYLLYYFTLGNSLLIWLFQVCPEFPSQIIFFLDEKYCMILFRLGMIKDAETFFTMFWKIRFNNYKILCRKYAVMKYNVNPKKLKKLEKRLKKK